VSAVLARAETAGVRQLIVPGWDGESSRQALALATTFPQLLPAIGLHPWFVAENPDLNWLSALLDDPRVTALGEIGIDGAIAGADPAQQEAIFRRQLHWAAARDLPVLIHCRRGWERTLAAVRETPGVRGVMHAFSGSRETLRECLHLGLYISFGGMVTRANSRRAQQAAMAVPADRLLLETDAPHMAMDGISAESVEPAHLPRILVFLASLRGDAPESLARQVGENARRLFATIA
jgi:TatD DNase family protein